MNIDKVMRILFYAGLVVLYCMGFPVEMILSVVFIPFLTEIVLINSFAKNVEQRNLFLPSLIGSSLGFAYRWYWNMYSFFNVKKWR